jgi:hypothetical protein
LLNFQVFVGFLDIFANFFSSVLLWSENMLIWFLCFDYMLLTRPSCVWDFHLDFFVCLLKGMLMVSKEICPFPPQSWQIRL